MGPMPSSPPLIVRFEKCEHAGGTPEAAEDILDLLALAAAFLLVVPLVEGHLEAVQAVE
jgi:hypothetical protein